MTLLSGIGIILSLVFGCLLLALFAELYYLLWWKKHTIITHNNTNTNTIEQNYTNHTKEIFFLFCGTKQQQQQQQSSNIITNHPNSNTILPTNPSLNPNNPDLEMGLVSNNKDLEGVEAELMRLHNLKCLFTIKEETKEDLESDDGKSPKFKGTPKILGQKSYNFNSNPLFESSVECELMRLRCSPPPKFKFLRDAEEKLYRKLIEEAQRSGIFQEEGILDISQSCDTGSMVEGKGSCESETVVRHTTTTL
ncbi:hypothetical protein RND81_05G269100 [Saponaria officinalis]|uniref:Transmembrane protein n=1 Tax=Saponaria officinalis TaxID=3572 RepID=A0AAW1L481_SAPOF